MWSFPRVEWMRKKDYLKRWLLPRAGLNHKITRNDGKTSTDYRGRPPGNLPEVMEWDNTCNVDVDLIVCFRKSIPGRAKSRLRPESF